MNGLDRKCGQLLTRFNISDISGSFLSFFQGNQTIVLQKFNPVDFLKTIQDYKSKRSNERDNYHSQSMCPLSSNG